MVLVSKPIAAGTPGLGPAGLIVGPNLRQEELVGDRQAGVVVGHREADRHLADRMFVFKRWLVPQDATSEGCAGWASAEPHA